MEKEEEVEILENAGSFRKWRLWLEHHLRSKGIEDHMLETLTPPADTAKTKEFL